MSWGLNRMVREKVLNILDEEKENKCDIITLYNEKSFCAGMLIIVQKSIRQCVGNWFRF